VPSLTWRSIHFPKALAVLFAGLFSLLMLSPPPVYAGTEGDPDEPAAEETAEESTSLGGVLRTRDDAGEVVFVEGVTMIVRDSTGAEVGQTVTDAEGNWRVDLPTEEFEQVGNSPTPTGSFTVELVVESLPEDVPLRNPGENVLEGIQVDLGEDKNTLFPLGEAVEVESNNIRSLQLFVDGVKLGLIIAMCSVGLSLIYGTTGLTNFAHGEMVTLGAILAFLFHMVYGSSGTDFEFFGLFKIYSDGQIFGIPGTNSLIFSAILAVILCAVAGWAFNEFVWRRLRNRGASLIAALVVSIGFAIFLRNFYQYQFGERSRFYRDYQVQKRLDLGWFELAPKDIFIIVFSVVVLLLVGLALQKTRAGKAMRAVADNRDLAESSGIDVESVIKWVWMAGSGLAGLGGILLATTEDVNFEMGFRLLLLMFAGVTLGGLGTAYGALLGSLIVGIFIQMITLVVPNDMKNIGAMAILVIILLVRPQGLLGRKERIG
jgi:branched-chain amino acid transport system permease protein